MTDEQELMASFRSMDKQAKIFTLKVAKGQAALWPEPTHLFLATSNLSCRPLLRESRNTQNVGFLSVCRTPE